MVRALRLKWQNLCGRIEEHALSGQEETEIFGEPGCRLLVREHNEKWPVEPPESLRQKKRGRRAPQAA